MPARAPGYDVIGYCTLYEMFADRRFVFKVVFDGKLHRCPRAKTVLHVISYIKVNGASVHPDM